MVKTSTVVKAQMAVNSIRALVGMLAGLAICGSGVWLLVGEIRGGATVHKEHVYIAASLIGFGALLIVPSVILGAAKEGVTLVGTYLPMRGGTRPADPPPKPPVDD